MQDEKNLENSGPQALSCIRITGMLDQILSLSLTPEILLS